MSRYLICSDIHLNINRRFDDTVSALEQIKQLIFKEKVDKVLILGDTFTSRRPHSQELAMFERWVRSIVAPPSATGSGVKFVILRGNHDEYPNGVHSYHSFEELQIKDVKIVTNPYIEDTIFMGHLLLREAKIGPTDYQLMEAMSTDELLAKYPNCKAYVLGDVHKHQILRENPLIMYSGSIEHVDFGERDDIKGVTILDVQFVALKPEGTIDDHHITAEFIPLKTRSMIQYDIDASNVGATVLHVNEIEDAIVKIIFHGTANEIARNVKEDVVRQMTSRAKELTIQYDVVRESVPTSQRIMSEQISAIDALSDYLKESSLSELEKTKVMTVGKEVIDATTRG
jgi:DNA repair exonuclease SbcCD nuclease subunit